MIDRLPPDLLDPPGFQPGRVCKLDGCETKHNSRGLCKRHYRQWLRHNDEAYRESQREYHRRRRAKKRREDPEYMARRRAANNAYYRRRKEEQQ